MNKKRIIGSMLVLTIAVLAIVASTSAFFSDTEVSENNTFTAGAIDLRVDSECTYNGELSRECGTWDLKDLGSAQPAITDQVVLSDKFFNFSDVKPGDYGENTISLHVRNNDAHACLIVDNMANDDIDLTEPETEDGDTTEGAGEGELAQAINVLAWDDDGDNIWEDGEKLLFTNEYGPASDVLDGQSYYLGTVPGGEFADETKTQYLGVYWCYGDIAYALGDDLIYKLTCDGSKLDNTTQTDQLTSDVWFYVEQLRHNEQGFECPKPRTQWDTWVDAVGAINDEAASSKEWYMRHVGSPAPTELYSHAYQWGPKMTCEPNTTPTTFTGTIDVSQMVKGNVSLIGLLDKGLMEEGKTGYQSGAYLYVYKNTDTTVRIGPSDGNINSGELIQVFKDYPIDDGILNISMTIYNKKINISVDGDTAMEDDYGFVKTGNNTYIYDWEEFASGAYPGWDNYPTSNYMPYNLSIGGCN